MASAAKSLQLGMRRCCAAASATSTTATTARTGSAARRTQLAAAVRIRCLSGTARQGAKDDSGKGPANKDHLEDWELEVLAKGHEADRIMSIRDAMRATLPADQQDSIPPVTDRKVREQEERILNTLRMDLSLSRRPEMSKEVKNSFWNEEEADPDMVVKESAEDEALEENDFTSMGHAKLDEIRERRHYARVAAWEMPLLAKLARPFEPPSVDMPLRFRFTSYMGEFHPAEKKVVVEFCPADLDLTEVQQNKLKKLAGARYNPETEIVRMSCESYEHQAQNKRYLGDLVETLIAEAKDPADTFEDIPLDTRHHKFKYKPKFPEAWRMTEERRKELQAIRAQSFLLDQKKAAEGTLVDGAQRVQASLAAPAPAPGSVGDRVAELVRLGPSRGQAPLRR